MINRTAPSPSDDYWAGGTIVVCSLWGLIGYIPCLTAIVTNNEIRNLAFYRLVVSLGIIDCLALIVWLLTGVFVLDHGNGIISQEFINLAMNFTVYLWYNIPLHFLVIAFNRFLGVRVPAKLKKYFQPARKTFYWLIAIHVISVIMAAGTWVPPGCYFSLDTYQFRYGSIGVENFYFTFEPLLSTFVVTTLAIFYGLILKELRRNAERVGDSQSADHQNAGKRRQIRMVVQVFIVSALFYVYVFAYYASALIVRDFWLYFVCGTLLWVFNHAVNAWVYLAFNPKIRGQLLSLARRENAAAGTNISVKFSAR